MNAPQLNIPQPKVKQVQATRENLPLQYAELLNDNPLLARIEGQCRAIGWTDSEIRTMQLLAACKSNSSLQQRLMELEAAIT
jgi:hypothetical protein